jgi:hypothetical protein
MNRTVPTKLQVLFHNFAQAIVFTTVAHQSAKTITMKFTSLAFLAGVFTTAMGETLPWIEDFAGIPNGEVDDNGPTSWSATRAGGIFEIKDGSLWINQGGGGSVGTLETGDIDVSDNYMVEVSVTIYGTGLMEDADFVELWAVLDGTKRVFLGKKKNVQASGTIIDGLVDTFGVNTLNVDIQAKVSATDEHYYIQEVSVTATDATTQDGCDYYDLSMDSLARGTYVSDQFTASHKVAISCFSTRSSANGKCRVFDSSIPAGEWDVAGAVAKCKSGTCDGGSCYDSQCGDPDLGVSPDARFGSVVSRKVFLILFSSLSVSQQPVSYTRIWGWRRWRTRQAR